MPDKLILGLPNIDRVTPLEVHTDGEVLNIRLARSDRRSRVREATERMMGAHDETLRKLSE